MMIQDGNSQKIVVAHIAAVTSIAAISALVMHYRNRKSTRTLQPPTEDDPLAPLCHRSESGRVGKIETFSEYLARQMGFEDEKECPQLTRLGHEYLKRSQGVDEKIYEYLENQDNTEDIYVKLVQEFERCIIAYFSFHWKHVPLIITQVLSVNSEHKRLKEIFIAATRKQRFDKIAKDLKVTRLFSTLLEEMKAIGTLSTNEELNHSDVMMPVALSERCPVLLLMGGGMGAGKSTVLKDIMQESFWSGAAAKAVVVEADAFKETDVIYQAINSRGHHQDMLQTSELVHQSSTDAASSLLVTALNEGRDVIMDGTLSWEPFVQQLIAMARNVHKHRYRMGDGYKVAEDGTITEKYWVQVEDEGELRNRKPYRIELVGVICDAYLAVVRGIRRAIQIGRAVRVNSQLKSHKRFATAFPRYCHLVDNARLYCTNAPGGPPRLIAWKDGDSNLLVDQDEIKCLTSVSNLNDEADSIYELYKEEKQISKPGSVWNDIVMLPTRSSLQMELKSTVKKIEMSVS